jgi:hypothetical protein
MDVHTDATFFLELRDLKIIRTDLLEECHRSIKLQSPQTAIEDVANQSLSVTDRFCGKFGTQIKQNRAYSLGNRLR